MTAITRYATVKEILNDTLVESGFDPVTSPTTSTAKHVVQMLYLLKSAGRELLKAYDWQQLVRETSVTINYGDTGEYDIPSDFEKMIPQTGWDRTNRYPLIGSASPQEWQYLKAIPNLTTGLTVIFRYNQNQIKILPTPPASGVDPYLVLYYEYLSRGWVQDAVTLPVSYKDFPENDDDTVLYDPTMMVKLLKLRYLGAKGFDTRDAVSQFTLAFEQVTGANIPGEVLSIAPGPRGFPFIDPIEVANIGS